MHRSILIDTYFLVSILSIAGTLLLPSVNKSHKARLATLPLIAGHFISFINRCHSPQLRVFILLKAVSLAMLFPFYFGYNRFLVGMVFRYRKKLIKRFMKMHMNLPG